MRSSARRRALALAWLLVALVALVSGEATGDVPIALRASYAGNLQVLGTGGTLRRFPNSLDACAVNDAGSANLPALPAGAQVVAAHLYWAGSWSARAGSAQIAPDWDVSLEGQPLSATKRYTARYRTDGVDYDFFQGGVEVTALVAAQGGGRYDFAGLDVNDGPPHCAVQAVVAGWSLMVIYRAAGEPLRVVNVYDGLQALRGQQVTLRPDNFRIPSGGRDGRLGVLAWEGDVENSDALYGVREALRFNQRALHDGLNPPGNPYNSTVNWNLDARSWGLDFDGFDVSSALQAGDSSATAVFAVGGDLVLLGAELLSVRNTPVADLAVAMEALGAFPPGGEGQLRLGVTNQGPSAAGDATLTLILPVGLTALASDAPGWTYDPSGAPRIVWRRSSSLPAGASAPPVNLRVAVAPSASGTLTLTASVASSTFDNIAANNQGTLSVVVGGALPDLVLLKSVQVVADPVNGAANPKAIPEAQVDYRLQLSNQGPGAADAESLSLIDALPAGMALFVGDLAGGSPVQFSDGAVPSGLSLHFGGLADATDDLDFSADSGASYAYVPVPGGDGCDPTVTHLRLRPSGHLAGYPGVGAAPSCTLRFRARLR